MLTVLQGDCLEVLPTLEAGSVQTCVCSPPYWGLRDYGTATWEGGDEACDHANGRQGATRRDVSPERLAERAKLYSTGTGSGSDVPPQQYADICAKCGASRIDSQLGLEATPEEYIVKMVKVFREVWRVLRDDGTLWCNMGDSYASNPASGGKQSDLMTGGEHKRTPQANGYYQRPPGLKPKDLCMMPARMAMALQADGWFLRQDIIWEKPNPMPESVRDRCCKSHEYMFLLSKSERYYFNADAIKEPASSQDLLSLQEESSDDFFLQEQTASGRYCGEVSGVHDGREEGLGPEIQPNRQSEGERETLLLFREGSRGQDSLSASLRDDGRATGQVPGSQSDSQARTTLQGSNGSILRNGQREGHEGAQGQGLPSNAQREVCEAQGGDQAQAPNQNGRLHIDSTGVDGDQSRSRPSVQVLRERTPAPRNGSRYPALEGRNAHGIERGPGLPDMQRDKGQSPVMRTKRSVWRVATFPFKSAHFATFPPDLIKPCILAGSRVGDTVLDPFAGSGTVGLVATEYGRKSVLIELNPSYCEMIRDRTNVTVGML